MLKMAVEIIIRDGGQDFTYEVSKETSDAIEAICEADNEGFLRDKQKMKEKLIRDLQSKKSDIDGLSLHPQVHKHAFNKGIDSAIKLIDGL